MQDVGPEAEIIFEPYMPMALKRALEYAGEDGFVASMPQLLRARVQADYDNIIWNTWFTSSTEESVITTPQRNRVIVAVHGGGIFGTPEPIEKMQRASVHRSSPEGYTGQYAGKIYEQEARGVLQGKLPDGTEIPVYLYDEFKQGIADLPMRYGVILDLQLARKSTRAYDPFDVLRVEPNFIVRAGDVEAAAACLDKAQARNNTKVMGNWHPHNRIDPGQPQTRVAFLAGNQDGAGTEDDDDHLHGYDAEYGMGGDASLGGMARYVAVVPRDAAMDLRHLDFGP